MEKSLNEVNISLWWNIQYKNQILLWKCIERKKHLSTTPYHTLVSYSNCFKLFRIVILKLDTQQKCHSLRITPHPIIAQDQKQIVKILRAQSIWKIGFVKWMIKLTRKNSGAENLYKCFRQLSIQCLGNLWFMISKSDEE